MASEEDQEADSEVAQEAASEEVPVVPVASEEDLVASEAALVDSEVAPEVDSEAAPEVDLEEDHKLI